jgi:hypothetical protein
LTSAWMRQVLPLACWQLLSYFKLELIEVEDGGPPL